MTGGGGFIPDGEEKVVLTRFLISICACCTSSVTSSRLRNSELVTCITTIIVKDLKHQLLVTCKNNPDGKQRKLNTESAHGIPFSCN